MSDENKTAQAPVTEPAQPTMAAPTGDAQTGQAPQATELTVQDLGVIKTIIEVAQSRGAFKANELEAVGKTFNKLDRMTTSEAQTGPALRNDNLTIESHLRQLNESDFLNLYKEITKSIRSNEL